MSALLPETDVIATHFRGITAFKRNSYSILFLSQGKRKRVHMNLRQNYASQGHLIFQHTVLVINLYPWEAWKPWPVPGLSGTLFSNKQAKTCLLAAIL